MAINVSVQAPELFKIPDRPGRPTTYKITVPGTRAKIFANADELAELYEQIRRELDAN